MRISKGEIHTGRFLIPYRRYGSAERSIVCVGGAQQTMAVWRSVISYFVADYSIVTFDLPGVGRSQVLDGPMQFSLEEQLLALSQVIDTTRRPGPLTLVGCSWGAMLGAAYAAQYPDAVDNLVLASFGIKPSAAMLEVIRAGQALYQRGEIVRAADLIINRFGNNISAGYKKQIVAQFARLSDAQAHSLYNHCSFVESVNHIDEFVPMHRIKARTLIINGADDTLLDLEDVQLAQARIPNCQARIVADAGHFLHFERPDILEIYADFLAH